MQRWQTRIVHNLTYHVAVAVVDLFEQACEVLLQLRIFYLWELPQLLERVHIPVPHLRRFGIAACCDLQPVAGGCL